MQYLHNKQFPNESTAYRDARNKLLEEEIKLRRRIEEVAELRRKLPQGGKIKENYIFDELGPNGNIKQTEFSDLFIPGKDTLIVYSFMYGLNDKVPCTSCNSIIDGIDGMVFHAEDRINFVAIAKSPIEKFKQWANGRGWKNVRILSSNKNSYNTDYFAEDDKGNQLPVLNVFRKTPEGIFHFYATELLYIKPEAGQDGRHVDLIWPLWNLFDLTPEGRGTNWYPRHSYSKPVQIKF